MWSFAGCTLGDPLVPDGDVTWIATPLSSPGVTGLVLDGDGFFKLDFLGTAVRCGAGKSCKGVEEVMVPDHDSQVGLKNVETPKQNEERNGRRRDADRKEAYRQINCSRMSRTLHKVICTPFSTRWSYIGVPAPA